VQDAAWGGFAGLVLCGITGGEVSCRLGAFARTGEPFVAPRELRCGWRYDGATTRDVSPVLPFQGGRWLWGLGSQGVALGYEVGPLRGDAGRLVFE
jgi:hypothetical protein